MGKCTLALILLSWSAVFAAQDVVIWNGGVSIEDRAAAPKMGTRLIFFDDEGVLRSDVQVLVKDAYGKELVNITTEGPWLILELPIGRYTVRAINVEGNAQGATIDVGGGRDVFGFMFRTD